MSKFVFSSFVKVLEFLQVIDLMECQDFVFLFFDVKTADKHTDFY